MLRRSVVALAATAGGLGLLLPACATRNGSVAAFCEQLPKTPAVSSLVTMAADPSPRAAATRIDATAVGMRDLERVAPRTVRGDVATTADFAERLASELRKLPDTPSSTSTTINPLDPPYLTAPDPREEVFSRMSRQYPGAVKATVAFVDYATKHCGPSVQLKGFDPNGPGLPGGYGYQGNEGDSGLLGN